MQVFLPSGESVEQKLKTLAEGAGLQGTGGVALSAAAYQEMFTSPKIQAIRSCSKYEQMVLQVLAGEFHRTGIEESSVGAVFRELSARLRREAMPVLSLPGEFSCRCFDRTFPWFCSQALWLRVPGFLL